MMKHKHRTLLSATYLVSLFTFLSRMLGFVRDMVLAQLFGAEALMDAFYVAFRVPNFMRRLFAEGAFSQAFVPVLAEYQQKESPENTALFIANVSGRLIMVLGVVTVVAILLSPFIITIFAPGFYQDGLRHVLASDMMRITFPYLFFISLTAMSSAILNTYGYFGVPAITPIFLNIVMILAALYLTPYCSPTVKGLAIGVLIAGVVQYLFQLPFLYRQGLLIRPRFTLHDEGVRRVIRLMVPALFGVSIAQLNLMIDTVFASFLKIGSVTWLYYTDRLADFPLGVFGVAISTVILPHLARKHHDSSNFQFSSALDWGLRLLLLIGVPSAIGIGVYAMPLIATCFGYGKFGVDNILQTERSTITLALGIPAFMMVKVLASGFYATQNIKTPVKVGVWVMVVNSIGCAIFIQFFQHAGLTLASSLAGYLNCFLLWYLLKKKGVYQPILGWKIFLVRLFFANTVIAFFLYNMKGTIDDWIALRAFDRLTMLLTVVLCTVLLYVMSLYLVGMRVTQFRSQLKRG
jgi:putative peptidoglycan lipid II flippase